MTKKVIAALFLFTISICLNKLASARTDSCPQFIQLTSTYSSQCLFQWGPNSFPDPNAPPTMVCCNPGADPWGLSCVALKAKCGPAPTFASDTCIACNRGKTANAGGVPIDLATGNTYTSQSDVSVPGLGGGLSLSRIWNSRLPATQRSYPFMFGAGWRSTYEERLVFVTGDGFLKYLRSDGAVWSFAAVSVSGPDVFQTAAPADDTTTTLTSGSPNWTLTSKSGEKRLFDATTGLLMSIIDRNGNTTQLAYDASNRLATVTDPASRHLYFNYPDSSSTLVSSVTSDFGISLSYIYDPQGRLTKVTKPDNASVSFDYDANSMMTAVKDSGGKVLESHTYDALGRGLTSSRANGVDAVTVTYPQ